jgi:hypothetical protein
MAQTERDMASVFALLPDNVTSQISPQDVRDAFASTMGYGCLLLAAGGNGTINGVGTGYTLVDIFDTIGAQSSDVNTSGVTATLAPDFRLTFGSTGFYRVSFFASFSSSANNILVTFREHKNGAPGPVEVDRSVRNVGDTGVVAFEDIEAESGGDYIDMRVKIDSGTTNLTFLASALSVHRVG